MQFGFTGLIVSPTPVATSRAGKPVNISDQATIVGKIVALFGTGSDVILTVLLADDLTQIRVPASTVYGTQSL